VVLPVEHRPVDWWPGGPNVLVFTTVGERVRVQAAPSSKVALLPAYNHIRATWTSTRPPPPKVLEGPRPSRVTRDLLDTDPRVAAGNRRRAS